MPIVLNKTLQGKTYTLYIISSARLQGSEGVAVEIQQTIYESKGHFDDGFLPIIKRDVLVTNQQRVNTIKTLLRQDYEEAISIIENFLVNNVPYYQGGSIVNGEVV